MQKRRLNYHLSMKQTDETLQWFQFHATKLKNGVSRMYFNIKIKTRLIITNSEEKVTRLPPEYEANRRTVVIISILRLQTENPSDRNKTNRVTFFSALLLFELIRHSGDNSNTVRIFNYNSKRELVSEWLKNGDVISSKWKTRWINGHCIINDALSQARSGLLSPNECIYTGRRWSKIGMRSFGDWPARHGRNSDRRWHI